MRMLGLILLWLGVAGFGLMTLCSGVFVPMAPAIALPLGLLVGALTWACWQGIKRLNRPDTPEAAHAPTPDEPGPPDLPRP